MYLQISHFVQKGNSISKLGSSAAVFLTSCNRLSDLEDFAAEEKAAWKPTFHRLTILSLYHRKNCNHAAHFQQWKLFFTEPINHAVELVKKLGFAEPCIYVLDEIFM